MKKTFSAVLALMFAFVAIFAISCVAFADEEDVDIVTTTAATTAAPTTTETTTAAATVSTTLLPEVPTSDTNSEVAVTGTTIAAEPNATAGTAPVVSNVPHTGSNVAVPALAVLALLAGTVAVVKTKKD